MTHAPPTETAPAGVPPVVTWYQRYCAFAIALFATGAAYGGYLVVRRSELAARWETEPTTVAMLGGLWALTLLFLAFVHFAALRTPPSQWAWKIHAIVLAIGLTTLVLWPLALPLLVYWFKPETRRFFGVRPSGRSTAA